MAITEELKEKIYAEVLVVNEGATEFGLQHCHEKFLVGKLYIVSFLLDGRRCDNYVFVRGGYIRVAKNIGHFIDLANQESQAGPLRRACAELLNIANIIAIVLTALIGYLVVVKDKTEIPAVLTTALTTIIGFYFGRATKKKD